MRHHMLISRPAMPAVAGVILPGFPGDHTVSFLKENLPTSLGEFVELIYIHLAAWIGPNGKE